MKHRVQRQLNRRMTPTPMAEGDIHIGYFITKEGRIEQINESKQSHFRFGFDQGKQDKI